MTSYCCHAYQPRGKQWWQTVGPGRAMEEGAEVGSGSNPVSTVLHSPALRSLVGGECLQILRCSICMEFFRIPIVLPCGHTFCLQCLTEMCQHAMRSRTTSPLKEVLIACPNCRVQIFAKPILERNVTCNFIIQSLVDILRNRTAPTKQDVCVNTDRSMVVPPVKAVSQEALTDVLRDVDRLAKALASRSVVDDAFFEIENLRQHHLSKRIAHSSISSTQTEHPNRVHRHRLSSGEQPLMVNCHVNRSVYTTGQKQNSDSEISLRESPGKCPNLEKIKYNTDASLVTISATGRAEDTNNASLAHGTQTVSFKQSTDYGALHLQPISGGNETLLRSHANTETDLQNVNQQHVYSSGKPLYTFSNDAVDLKTKRSREALNGEVVGSTSFCIKSDVGNMSTYNPCYSEGSRLGNPAKGPDREVFTIEKFACISTNHNPSEMSVDASGLLSKAGAIEGSRMDKTRNSGAAGDVAHTLPTPPPMTNSYQRLNIRDRPYSAVLCSSRRESSIMKPKSLNSASQFETDLFKDSNCNSSDSQAFISGPRNMLNQYNENDLFAGFSVERAISSLHDWNYNNVTDFESVWSPNKFTLEDLPDCPCSLNKLALEELPDCQCLPNKFTLEDLPDCHCSQSKLISEDQPDCDWPPNKLTEAHMPGVSVDISKQPARMSESHTSVMSKL